jgi:hypothetical protein
VALAASAEEPASITIAPSEDRTYEASAGTKLQIPCTVTRHGEFTAPLKLKPLGLPSTALKETEIDGKATNSVLHLDLAKIQPGDYVFVLNGDLQGKYIASTNSGTKPKDVTVSVFSKPIDLHVTPAPSK